MAAFEGSYKSLLQGVSQQVARERLDGQVSAQQNMLSDPVTNLRRRGGAKYVTSQTIANVTHDTVCAFGTDISGKQLHVLLDVLTGTLRIYDAAWVLLQTFTNVPYLQAASSSSIRYTSVGNEMFLLNMTKVPAAGYTQAGPDPDKMGFYYVTSSAYSRTFDMTVTSSQGSVTVGYTTPDGAGTGDGDLASPTHIATQLRTLYNAANGSTTTGVVVAQRGPSLGFTSATATGVKITSSSSHVYVLPSNAQAITTISYLPPALPDNVSGIIVSVGTGRTPTYYQYNSDSWAECAKYGSATSITNMPVSIYYDYTLSTFVLDSSAYEGSLAGEDATGSNPLPPFVGYGISGIGTFQGRLVLLAGTYANLSASNLPRRFFRSTITAVVADDTISVGASANSSAVYHYCVPFMKDLLLFSDKYQALIPSGSAAITPSTATVVLTSNYNADMGACPVTIGRTMIFPATRSTDFVGLMEMLPSAYTDSQYISQDATSHLPKYIPGTCRFMASSTASNMLVVGSTGDTQALTVHEYMWDGDKKAQQAWHRWTFPYSIATAYFFGSELIIVMVNNGQAVIATVDPRVGLLTTAANRRPFLDLYYLTSITDNVVTIPAWMLALDADIASTLKLSYATGDLAGEAVGFTDSGDGTLKTVRSYPSGAVYIGVPYTSLVSPSAPLIKDANGVKISSNKLGILRYTVGTVGSYEFGVSVMDARGDYDATSDVPTLYWSSQELQLGVARNNGEDVSIVPCRTAADTTVLSIFTEGLGELNIISMEYTCRYNQKLRRR